MTSPDRVDLALRAGKAEHTIKVIGDLCHTHPQQVPTAEIQAAIRDPYAKRGDQ